MKILYRVNTVTVDLGCGCGTKRTHYTQNDITSDLLGVMLSVYIDDFEKGSIFAKRYMDFLKKNNVEGEIFRYYNTIYCILQMKKNLKNKEDIEKILSNFMESSYINNIMEDIDKNNILKYFPVLSCPNCDSCCVNNLCCHNNENKLFNKLIEQSFMNSN